MLYSSEYQVMKYFSAMLCQKLLKKLILLIYGNKYEKIYFKIYIG